MIVDLLDNIELNQESCYFVESIKRSGMGLHSTDDIDPLDSPYAIFGFIVQSLSAFLHVRLGRGRLVLT